MVTLICVGLTVSVILWGLVFIGIYYDFHPRKYKKK